MEKRNLAISLKCLSACNLQLPLSGMTYLQGKQVPSHSASQQLDWVRPNTWISTNKARSENTTNISHNTQRSVTRHIGRTKPDKLRKNQQYYHLKCQAKNKHCCFYLHFGQ